MYVSGDHKGSPLLFKLEENMQGLIHVYTGDGKGKTTAALGLGMRAAGCGLKVIMIQFLKDNDCGELCSCEKLGENFEIKRFQKGHKGFIWEMTEEEIEILKKETKDGFDFAVKTAKNGECDVLILDEIFGCVGNMLLTENDIIDMLDKKSEKTEIVLTGRNAPDSICKKAHYVTEMRGIKHPLYSGISARRGIEY